MGSAPRHWQRPLKDGGVEFFFRVEGHWMRGTVESPAGARFLRERFEEWTGMELPPPTIKKPRGSWATTS